MTTNPEQRHSDHADRDRELTELLGDDRFAVDVLSAHADRRQRLHDRQVRNLSVDVARVLPNATTRRRITLMRLALPTLAAASLALFMVSRTPETYTNQVAPASLTTRHAPTPAAEAVAAAAVVVP
ncbi:MAG: hypothetical protein FGM24_10980, partial [Candidatus Kapabacteria bacterium]|nr:hypothetical protein [Candidatus Kapabacteria bacterium]